ARSANQSDHLGLDFEAGEAGSDGARLPRSEPVRAMHTQVGDDRRAGPEVGQVRIGKILETLFILWLRQARRSGGEGDGDGENWRFHEMSRFDPGPPLGG